MSFFFFFSRHLSNCAHTYTYSFIFFLLHKKERDSQPREITYIHCHLEERVFFSLRSLFLSSSVHFKFAKQTVIVLHTFPFLSCGSSSFPFSTFEKSLNQHSLFFPFSFRYFFLPCQSPVFENHYIFFSIFLNSWCLFAPFSHRTKKSQTTQHTPKKKRKKKNIHRFHPVSAPLFSSTLSTPTHSSFFPFLLPLSSSPSSFFSFFTHTSLKKFSRLSDCLPRILSSRAFFSLFLSSLFLFFYFPICHSELTFFPPLHRESLYVFEKERRR